MLHILRGNFNPSSVSIFFRRPNHHIYLRLMIDGEPSKPFSATTLPPDDTIDLRRPKAM